MAKLEVNAVKTDPRIFLDFLKANKYSVYHKSNIFFRDFQYGLWRYLKGSQSKIPYADMESVTLDVVTDWEKKGILKRVNRQSFELNMPEYAIVGATAEDGKVETEPPKGKPAPASGPAANQEPAATEATGASPASGTDPDKAAKIKELQEKMAAAKAKREAGGGEAPTAASATSTAGSEPATASAPATAPTTESVTEPAAGTSGGKDLHIPPGTDPEKAAKIKALQEKMAAAKAKRESGGGE